MSDELLTRLDAVCVSEENSRLCHSAARRIRELQAQLAAPVAVKVKPLVWTDRKDGAFSAGVYAVRPSHGQGPEPFMLTFGTRIVSWHPDADAAKSAAQAHHEAHTLSSVSGRASTLTQARADALEDAAKIVRDMAQEILDHHSPASAVNALKAADRAIRALKDATP